MLVAARPLQLDCKRCLASAVGRDPCGRVIQVSDSRPKVRLLMRRTVYAVDVGIAPVNLPLDEYLPLRFIGPAHAGQSRYQQ